MKHQQEPPRALLLDIVYHPSIRVYFFSFLALITITMFFLIEWPLISADSASHIRLVSMGWLLFPHILCGSVALVIGPFQFSHRLRKNNVKLHRLLGKIYIIAILLAAPLAFITNLTYPIPGQTWKATFEQATVVFCWITTTSMAWFTIRRRLVTLHKIWMSRSYGITFFTFVVSRVIGPIPFVGNMDFDTFTILLWFFLVLGLIVPEIILNYKEVFAKRKVVSK